MTEQANVEDAKRSEDQQAIAEYFASDAYRRREMVPADKTDRAWVLDAIWLDHDVVPTTSFCWGLLGLTGILAFFGFMMPLEIELVEQYFNPGRSTFVMQAIIFQTFLFPPALSFAFATVTPMFWYGSIVLRFVIATLMVLPGCLAFYLMARWTGEFPSGDDFWVGFGCVMFSLFLTVGTIALTVQMWSPWVLSHARPRGASLPTLGTRSMMELTVIAAVGFAVIVSIDSAEYLEGIVFFVVMGCIASPAVISLLIACLRDGQRNYRAAIVSGTLVLVGSFLFSGFMAVMEFGWQSMLFNVPLVATASLYGAVLICAVMWLCLWWLRSCGWLCINRNDAKRDRSAWIKEAAES